MYFAPSFPGTSGHSTASAARSEAAPARSELESLKMDAERLLMITEALWMILKEKHGLDDNDLVRRIVEIDMRDGKLDGKLPAEAPRKCPKCERTLFKKMPRCLYCGEPVAPEPFER
jgi:hypothetical protein